MIPVSVENAEEIERLEDDLFFMEYMGYYYSKEDSENDDED